MCFEIPALHLNPPFPWAGGSGETSARQLNTRNGIWTLESRDTTTLAGQSILEVGDTLE